MESKFKNVTQTAVSGTKHTVSTVKNETIHRKLIPNPLPFRQATTTPAQRINTRQNATDQPTCSKTSQTTAELPASTAGKKHQKPSQTTKGAKTG